MIYYALLILMTFIASLASLFFKLASTGNGFLDLLKDIKLYIGGALYVLAALLNIYILRYLDYSVAMPLGAITYIWTMLVSRKVLKERITMKKMLGTAMVVAGAFLVAV